jgi:AcrR family transcriptional regulator
METPTTSPAVASGRREQNKTAKRQRLIAAARLLFRTHGFETTTAAAIAREAGVGSGTFYLYFDSKEALLIEIYTVEVERIWDDAFMLVRPHAPLVDQVLAVYARATDGHDRDPELSRVFFREMHFAASPVRAAGAAITAHIHGRMGDLFAQAVERGELDPAVDFETLSETIFDVWYYAMLRHYGRPITADEVQRSLQRSVRLLLDHMRPSIPSGRGDPERGGESS